MTSLQVKKEDPGKIIIMPTHKFEPMWNDSGSGADADVSLWRPVLKNPRFDSPDFHILGDMAMPGHKQQPDMGYAVRGIVPGAVQHPVSWSRVWTDRGSGADKDVTIWKPNPPKGYECLGHMVGKKEPGNEEIWCLREDLVEVCGDDAGHRPACVWGGGGGQPPIRQLLGAADAQMAHHATSSTAPTHQMLGSANAETTPARAPAAAADRKQRPDATREGKTG